MSSGTEDKPRHDLRGAWIVEALIAALVLLLIGKSIGVAISLYAFLLALVFAVLLVLGARAARNRLAKRR
jgi:hypothetical protein